MNCALDNNIDTYCLVFTLRFFSITRLIAIKNFNCTAALLINTAFPGSRESVPPKRRVDWFRHFWRTHPCVQHTQTTKHALSEAIGHIYATHAMCSVGDSNWAKGLKPTYIQPKPMQTDKTTKYPLNTRKCTLTQQNITQQFDSGQTGHDRQICPLIWTSEC